MRSLLVVAGLVMSRLAVAAPGVGVVVTGEPTMQAPITAELGGWLQEHGYEIIANALADDGRHTFADCFVLEDITCAQQVFERQAHADSIVFVRVELHPAAHRQLTLTGYWFVKGHDAVVDKRACSPCTDADLSNGLDDMMNVLSTTSGLGKSRLEIQSQPTGLVVMLDKVNIGITPVARDVTSGPHEIRIVQDGRDAAVKAITAKAGEVMALTIPIDPPHRILPVALFAVGVAAIATSGVFFYYGHKGDPTDVYIYPTATRTGAIVAGVGGAAVIAGLVWWWRGPAATSAPSASISRDGTLVGWAGRF